MKTRLPTALVLGLALAATSSPGALAQQELNPSLAVPRAQAPAASPGPAATNLVVQPVTAPPDSTLPLTLAPVGASSSQSQPASSSTYQSPWSTEVVKLARAGIEDGVLLSYIDSAGTFNLDPDQIIYLRDLGVSGYVIGAMMQHDLEFAAGWRPPGAPTAPLPQTTFHLMFAPGPGSAGAAAPAPAPPAPSSAAALTSAPLVNGEPPGFITDTTPPDFSNLWLARSEPASLPGTPALGGRTQTPGGAYYPVREPYPVELMEPIIFVQGEDRMANVVFIRMPR